MCDENSHKHARAQCSLALLFTLYARNYFRVVGLSLGSTPRLATPRALDIAQLAERLTVVVYKHVSIGHRFDSGCRDTRPPS